METEKVLGIIQHNSIWSDYRLPSGVGEQYRLRRVIMKDEAKTNIPARCVRSRHCGRFRDALMRIISLALQMNRSTYGQIR